MNFDFKVDELCNYCKVNKRVYCPHKPILKLKSQKIFEKTSFFGPTPPSVFVGHYNYPMVSTSSILLLDEKINPNPKYWYGLDFQKLFYIASMQIKAQAPLTNQRILENIKETALSLKHVDIEAEYKNKPKLIINFDQVNNPLGPIAKLKDFKIAQNISVPKKIEELLQEDIKTTQAIEKLVLNGFDEFYITRLFSIGLLGKKHSKHLVPTKWSITATDNLIANFYIKKLKALPILDFILLFENEYLGNRFFIILLPKPWGFENIECWIANNKNKYAISKEWEGYDLRTKYASSQGGGYYAAKHAIAESLVNIIRKQAAVVVIREITPKYALAVGVWEVRESIRNAFKKTPLKFANIKELFYYLKEKLLLDLRIYLARSDFLEQKTLDKFY